MALPYYSGGVLVLMVVVFVFAGNSYADITLEFGNITEVEKLVTSQAYQDKMEAMIMNNSDKFSKTARSAIEGIRKDVLSRPQSDDRVFQDAMNELINSILSAIRIVYAAERLAREKFESAKNLTVHEPRAAADSIKNNTKILEYFIFTSGVPIQDTFGSALALAGGSNHKGIKKGIDAIENAGNSIMESLKIAENLAITGIEAGGSAAVEGVNAAIEAFQSGSTAVFEYCHLSAQNVLEGSSLVVLNEVNRIPGILESLKSEVSIDSRAGLAAIARLQKGFKSMLSDGLVSQTKIDAAKILTQSLISTILETADAIDMAKKAIIEAEELSSRDREAAVSMIHTAIKRAREGLTKGTTIGLLGFGSARFIAGRIPIDGLIHAMMEIIFGRIAVYEGLQYAEDIAIIGIDAGGLATAHGVNAALRICEAAGNELYTQFVEGGEEGLNIFQGV